MYNFKGINNKEISEFKATPAKVIAHKYEEESEEITYDYINKKTLSFFTAEKHNPIIIITKPEEEQVRTGHRICCD